MPPVRILHAPTDVAGHAFGLSRAERRLGLESDVALVSPGPYGYRYDIDLRAGVDRPVWRRLYRRAAFLRRAVREYDVFHFNFGQTLLTVRQFGIVLDELAWLKRRGKTILVSYLGSDVRPSAACPCTRPSCRAADRYRAAAAKRFGRYADRIFYVNPDLRKWLPRGRFMPYASIDPRELSPSRLPERDELVVAHAPTDREIKGTRHVVEAVERLRGGGVCVRLDLVEGVTRDEVLRRIAAADVVVDQLLVGWYGTFAVEAMALGRPVLSYVREDEPDDNPFGASLPVVRTSPRTLVEDLAAVLADRARREELGRAGRAFAEEHHDPVAIAREALEGIVPLPHDGQDGGTM